MNERTYHFALAAAIILGSWLLGWLFRTVVASRLRSLFKRSRSHLDDLLLASYGPHVPFWFLIVGVLASVRYLDVSADWLRILDRAALGAVIFSVTLATASFAGRLMAGGGQTSIGGLPTTTLTQNVARIVVISLGVMVILSNLGVAITPILTALGVGSLAVALALQPTLTNLFAGFHISLARQIRVGDFVELETGQQGFVVDIGWRSTQIRELPNNMILIPNARLAEIIVKNFALPDPEQAVLVQVGVSYASDLGHVEHVTQEVARETMQSVPGAVAFDPFIRYHTFGDSSINLTVILRVRDFPDRHLLTHEFIRRLHARYAEEGIEIPFPQRVVHMAESGPRER